jgi:hypothetical protein
VFLGPIVGYILLYGADILLFGVKRDWSIDNNIIGIYTEWYRPAISLLISQT